MNHLNFLPRYSPQKSGRRNRQEFIVQILHKCHIYLFLLSRNFPGKIPCEEETLKKKRQRYSSSDPEDESAEQSAMKNCAQEKIQPNGSHNKFYCRHYIYTLLSDSLQHLL
jgi:hypothetical protein